MKPGQSGWHLYWVSSDGLEDCFVAAKNSRSARSVEIQMNGFEPSYVSAEKILSIPPSIATWYSRAKGKDQRKWPWYVYGKQFFAKLGAEFRRVGDVEEMLLKYVVYEVQEYAPCSIIRCRSIGLRAIQEMKADLSGLDFKYEKEDVWSSPEVHIVTALGMCLIRCQQIEHYIVNSFILGVSKKQKRKYATINDLRKGWKKKTLGNLIQCIEEAWEIDDLFKTNLLIYLDNRNLLVHGITVDDRFDILTRWGQLELLSFLHFFDVHSRAVRSAFKASYYASLEFGIRHWGVPEKLPKSVLRKIQREDVSVFFEFFKPRAGAI